MNQLIKSEQRYLTNTVTPDLMRRFVGFIDARPKTIETYTRALKQFVRFLAENDIETPKREDIINYREQLKATGHKPGTVSLYIISVRQFFKWTGSEGIYPDVGINIKGSKIDKTHKKDPLTSNQIKSVLQGIDRETLRGARDYAILATMTTGGLRDIEISRAAVDDMRALGDSTVLYIQGKGHDERSDYVKIPEPTEKAIRRYLMIRGPVDGTAPLFESLSHNNQGQHMTTRSISRIVKDRFIAAGLNSDRLTAHSLRHTAATLNLLNGGTLDETQQLLRHTNINTTLIYSHHLDRLKNQSESRIATAIF